jgi:hypothetical protein
MTTKQYGMKVRKWFGGVLAAIAVFVLIPSVGLASPKTAETAVQNAPLTANAAYYQDCGIATCTRWVNVASTKWMYDNRMNSTNAAWAAVAGVKCGAYGVFIWAPAGVGCVAWDGYMVYKMNKALEDASRNKGCVKWKWSRQFGQVYPTDWSWTTPARDAKCKWS